MRRMLAICMTLTSVAPGAAIGSDHVVSPLAIEARLAEAAKARATDLAAVDRALSTPEAASVATAAGVHVTDLKAAAASLTDTELRDLAVRARALDTDPAAGLSREVDLLLVVFLAVALVILLVEAVD
jgi:hypothetical protein